MSEELYSQTLLRICLGMLFIFPGLDKLFDPSRMVQMLDQFGLPAAALFTWLLIFIELIGGFLLLLGFRIRYVILPLMGILLLAIVLVIKPQLAASGNPMSLLLHVVALAALLELYFVGPGKWAFDTLE